MNAVDVVDFATHFAMGALIALAAVDACRIVARRWKGHR